MAALARELREEIGVQLEARSVEWLGEFEDSATHEPGRRVNAQVYRCSIAGVPVPGAEIAELAWVYPDGPHDIAIASLSRLQILPGLAGLRPCMSLRKATPSDARILAELVNLAGEGLPAYVWNELALPGETSLDVGQQRARREDSAFSYRNAVVCESGGEVVSCMVGYPLKQVSQAEDLDAMPAMFVPLQQLEDLAVGCWYINVLATLRSHRGLGCASRFLAIAQAHSRALGLGGMSIIVSDSNESARRLYEGFGFAEHARRPMIKEGWSHPGSEWVLLVKGL